MSGSETGPGAGGEGDSSEVLRLGLDASGVKEGGDRAKLTLEQLKKAAADLGVALDGVARPAGKTGTTLAGLHKDSQTTIAGMQGVTSASSLMTNALGFAQRAALALGVAWGGMQVSQIIGNMVEAAARVETLGAVLTRVGQNTNHSGREIAQYTQQVERMGITTQAARTSMIQMIQAHIDLSQASKLARVAQDAAVVGNINSSEAFTRLVHGIQSGEVEILRTMGLNVDFQASYEQLAASLGKSVAALTVQEKSQAKVNAAMQAGMGITGAYTSAMDTAGKMMQSLTRYTDNASAMLGTALLPAFTSLVSQVTAGMASLNKALSADMAQGSSGWLGTIGEGLRSVADNAGAAVGAIGIGFGVTLVLALGKFLTSLVLVRTAIAGLFIGSPWLLAIGAVVAALAYLASRQDPVQRNADLFSKTLRDQGKAAGEAAGSTDKLTESEKRLADFQANEATKRAQRNLVTQQLALKEQIDSIAPDAFRDTTKRGLQPTAETNAPVRSTDPVDLQLRRLAIARAEFGKSDRGDDALAAFTARFDELNRAVPEGSEKWDRWTANLKLAMNSIKDGKEGLKGLEKAVNDVKTAIDSAGFERLNLPELQTAIRANLGNVGLALDPAGNFGTPDRVKNRNVGETLKGQWDSLYQAARDTSSQVEKLVLNGADRNSAPVLELMKDGVALLKQMEQLAPHMADVWRAAGEAMRTPFDKLQQTTREQISLAMAMTPAAKIAQQASNEAANFMRENKDYDVQARQALGLPKDAALSNDQRGQFQQQLTSMYAAPQTIARSQQMGQAAAEAEIQARFALRIASAQADGAEAVRKARSEMEMALEAQRGTANYAAMTAKSWADIATSIGETVVKLREMVGEQQQSAQLADAKARGDYAAVGRLELEAEQNRIRGSLGLSRNLPELQGMPAMPDMPRTQTRTAEVMLDTSRAAPQMQSASAFSEIPRTQVKAPEPAVTPAPSYGTESQAEIVKGFSELAVPLEKNNTLTEAILAQLRSTQATSEMPLASAAPTMGAAPSPTSASGTQSEIVKGFAGLMAQVEQANALPTGILARIAQKESSGDPSAINPKSGAAGLMGILESTAKDPGYGTKPISAQDRFDPAQSIVFAGSYLGGRIKSGGSVEAGVSGYSGKEYTAAQLMGTRPALISSTGGAQPGVGAPSVEMPRAITEYFEQQTRIAAEQSIRTKTTERLGSQIQNNEESIRGARNELDTTFMSDTARANTIASRNLETQAVRELQGAVSEQHGAEIAGRFEVLRGQEETLAMLREQQELANRWKEAGSSAGSAISSGLHAVIIEGKGAKETLAGVLKELEQIIWRAAVTKPLEQAMGNLFGGAFGMIGSIGMAAATGGAGGGDWGGEFVGGGYAKGGAFGGGIEGLSNQIIEQPHAFTFAKGGDFSGGVQGLSNQVIEQPRAFAFAEGSMGIAGEKGPEAILPLMRDSEGNLGVRQLGGEGGGSGGGGTVTVNAPITIGSSSVKGGQLEPDAARRLQMEIDRTVRAAVRETLGDEMRPGGDLRR